MKMRNPAWVTNISVLHGVLCDSAVGWVDELPKEAREVPGIILRSVLFISSFCFVGSWRQKAGEEVAEIIGDDERWELCLSFAVVSPRPSR